MPTRDHAPLGAPSWVDLMTSDVDRSRTFYSQLLGWEAAEPNAELGGYVNFSRGGVRAAGCMASQQPGMPDAWSVHLATDDAAKTVAAAEANGGTVIVPAMPVADLGTMAMVADPGGAAVGMWQPGTHTGFGAVGETGFPSWFELSTRDLPGAVAFYREVFRWDTHVVSDTPEFRYTVLVRDGEWLAGIVDASAMLPAGVPAHWSVYFGVDDTDAALARTVELGGAIVRPAEDSPYGRLGEATDATGAGFKLVAPNESMPARS